MTIQINSRPKVIIWFKVYAILLSLIYFFMVIISPIFLLSGESGFILSGLFIIILCFPLFIISILPVFLPRRPWVWVYSLIIIGIGMTSACCLPASLPLLIFWLKPDVKRFYGYKEKYLT